MRIAGVYASAFLLFGRKKKYFFLIFKTVVNMYKRETIFLFCKNKDVKQIFMCIETRNSKNYTPGLQIQIRIPPSSFSRHKPVHLQQVAGIMPN